MTHIDRTQIEIRVATGAINEQRHPSLPISIYNYSQRCQFERLWDDVTLQCRGLILSDEEIVARPFRKFFNDTEHQESEIPWHLANEVTEKLDGSLLICFWFEGRWYFATRGSFASKQAERGRQIFESRHSYSDLVIGMTYLFEVIYPENRIVVNYGDTEDVILLAMIETDTGVEWPLDRAPHGFNVVRRLPPDASAKELRSIITDDQEGYVVRFENGFRVKVKGQRYIELHRLICGTSSRTIWEALSTNQSFDEMLAVIPDEFGDWVRRERDSLIAAFNAMSARTEEAYLAVNCLPDRKSQAMKIKAEFADVSSAAFLALDGKPTAPALWKKLYPEFRRPEVAARIEA